MYLTMVTICTSQWSLYVPYSGHYITSVVTICTAQWSLYVPHSGRYMYHQFNIHNSTFFPHTVFMCFVWISEQTAIISLYNINWLVCITQTQSVYCAVRTRKSKTFQAYCIFRALDSKCPVSHPGSKGSISIQYICDLCCKARQNERYLPQYCSFSPIVVILQMIHTDLLVSITAIRRTSWWSVSTSNRTKLFQISVKIIQKRTVKLGPELFRAVIQRWFLVGSRSCGTTHRSHFEGSSCLHGSRELENGTNYCTETSAKSYQPTLRKIQEDRRSQPNPDGLFLVFRPVMTL